MIEQRTKARLLGKNIKSKAHGGGSESTTAMESRKSQSVKSR
jgi:hypothetical protein